MADKEKIKVEKIEEGMIKKGGLNSVPSTPRPAEPPKPSTPRLSEPPKPQPPKVEPPKQQDKE